jgi:cardiolipin-specific phospholipase
MDKFYLVGHSFGGYISILYASKYPEKIIHLHLVSPLGGS